MLHQIQWLGHGSFIIQGAPLIYVNPWRVPKSVFHADVILISHDHYDHCSPADVEKLRGPHTRVIGNERTAAQIENCEVLRPWQSVNIDRASIKAVPAYSPHDWRHPYSDGGLGFVISLNFHDIYYAGDTGIIPEMQRIKPDIAILPIDDNGTLSVDAAVEVVRMMRPRQVIPSNWGANGIGASLFDVRDFARQIGNLAEVVVLEPVR